MGDNRSRAYTIASALATTAALYGWMGTRRIVPTQPPASAAPVGLDASDRGEAQPDGLWVPSTHAGSRAAAPPPEADEPREEGCIIVEITCDGASAGLAGGPAPELPFAEEVPSSDVFVAGEGSCGEGTCGESSCGEGTCS